MQSHHVEIMAKYQNSNILTILSTLFIKQLATATENILSLSKTKNVNVIKYSWIWRQEMSVKTLTHHFQLSKLLILFVVRRQFEWSFEKLFDLNKLYDCYLTTFVWENKFYWQFHIWIWTKTGASLDLRTDSQHAVFLSARKIDSRDFMDIMFAKSGVKVNSLMEKHLNGECGDKLTFKIWFVQIDILHGDCLDWKHKNILISSQCTDQE